MKCSDKIDLLATAMAKAQDAMKPAIKDSKANYGKYADLASVWEACREALAANGLSVLQGLGIEGGTDGHLWTMLLHSSGQWVQGECPLILGKRDPQGVGAAMTYYRRYGLAAMLGITQEDDDGQSTMPTRTAQPSKAEAPKPTQAPTQAGFDWAAKMEEATDTADLEAIWTLIPANLRGELFKKKMEIKTKLGGK